MSDALFETTAAPDLTAGAADQTTSGLLSGEGGSPLVITVRGTPGPQGSKRYVGHGVMVESSKKVKPWREAVKAAAADAMPSSWQRLTDVPIEVAVVFHFDKPGNAPKRRRTWPIKRSTFDVDKLVRSTFDALTDAGVFKDDSQVTRVVAEKVFTDDPLAGLPVPGAVICVWQVT